jgi:hypothetical protein
VTGHDVFLSFAGPERDAIRRIRDALEQRGLSVWLDESLPPASSITAGIEEHLNASRIMLVLYSAAYPLRPACQFELAAAFLAGQHEGDPLQRIMVINPEPSERHIQPIQLADAKFVRLPGPGDDRAMTALVDAVAQKVAMVKTTFGGISFTESPRWYPDGSAGTPAFVGRYREQWALHTELHRVDHPMITTVTNGPVVALSGLAGSGKSTLAAAYAWQFGAVYPGGIFRTSLSGASAADALARYGDQLRSVAAALEIQTGDHADRAELTSAVADHIHAAQRPALWIIDDVPQGLSRDALAQLLLPAGTAVRTIMIGRQDMFGGVAPAVELGAMSLEDSCAMLRMYREPDDSEDELAAERVARRLGGHPFSLGLAAAQLTDKQGLHSYADYLERLDSDPAAISPATRLISAVLEQLDLGQRLLLQVAALLAPAALPAAALARIVTAARPGSDPADDLAALRKLQLASRTGDQWQVHSIVLEATRRQLPPVTGADDLASVAADVLLDETMIEKAAAQLAPHLAALADHALLDAERSGRLRRRLIEHFCQHGEWVPAAGQWDRLLAAVGPAVADLLAAATANLRAGAYERAIELTRQAQQLPGYDAESTMASMRIKAQCLDALGHFDEADQWWPRVASAAPTSAEAELAYIHSRRLRGEMRTARGRADKLVTRLRGSNGDMLQAARIELATIQLSTNQQLEARRTAEEVVRHYAQRQLPGHTNAVAAQSVLAQAWLTLHLFELNPDPQRWRDAARQLWETREQLRRSHGPLNAQTLTTDVEYGFALLCLGQPIQAHAHLTTTLEKLGRRFPADHPVIMRATLLLGRAHAQLWEYERSRELHQKAYDGLRSTLGPRHPETLAAQYGLGVALKLTGADSLGYQMIWQVAKAAPSVVGFKTDMFGQSLIGTLILPIVPGRAMRWIGRLGSSAPKTRRHDVTAVRCSVTAAVVRDRAGVYAGQAASRGHGRLSHS